MTPDKAPKQTERVNIVMPESVQKLAADLMRARFKGDNFSELLRDLIIEEAKRPETLAKAELEWLNKAFREALTENVKLKEENLKLKAKVEDMRQDRKIQSETLHLCEEDLKKARDKSL